MQNKKLWLALKACFIVIITISIFYLPQKNTVRLILRFGILTFLVFTFIRDVIAYKKQHHD